MEKDKTRYQQPRPVKPFQTKLLLGLIALACLTPLGIILPRLFDSRGAWGEWGTAHLEKALGYVPAGLMRTIHLWKAPVRDYSFSLQGSSFSAQLFSYAASCFLGLLLVVSIVLVMMRIIRKHER